MADYRNGNLNCRLSWRAALSDVIVKACSFAEGNFSNAQRMQIQISSDPLSYLITLPVFVSTIKPIPHEEQCIALGMLHSWNSNHLPARFVSQSRRHSYRNSKSKSLAYYRWYYIPLGIGSCNPFVLRAPDLAHWQTNLFHSDINYRTPLAFYEQKIHAFIRFQKILQTMKKCIVTSNNFLLLLYCIFFYFWLWMYNNSCSKVNSTEQNWNLRGFELGSPLCKTSTLKITHKQIVTTAFKVTFSYYFCSDSYNSYNWIYFISLSSNISFNVTLNWIERKFKITPRIFNPKF